MILTVADLGAQNTSRMEKKSEKIEQWPVPGYECRILGMKIYTYRDYHKP